MEDQVKSYLVRPTGDFYNPTSYKYLIENDATVEHRVNIDNILL